jgi:alpha-1,4-digalacturonate transport system permease protein
LTSSTRRRGGRRLDWTDWVTYGYLASGLLLMFGPVLWLVMSSFKTESALTEFPPSLLPTGPKMVAVTGVDKPRPLFKVTLPDGSVRELAELRRIGLTATMVDPAHPETEIKVPIDQRQPIRAFGPRHRETTRTSPASSRSARTCGTASSSR